MKKLDLVANKLMGQIVLMADEEKFYPDPNNRMEKYTRPQLLFIRRGILSYENEPYGNKGGWDSTIRELFPALAQWAGIK
ncbi:hypothetical protein [Paenibacillus borealis]|uniref:Uncharacterized protein n=1 Tax=Paenibacillus borealis TaxID=160799 RepID=A0A089LHW8_PAEBO|nr:hypothetical protein [Paenibacillus borealis]AIQ59705.1 hypothetical protein PBOR_24170 [Paenibacillus borealis]